MKSRKTLLAAFCLTAIASVAQAQSTTQTADPQAQSLKWLYDFNKRNILAAAEKMPAEHYGFKPAAEIRSYAELVGHVADVNYLICSTVKGEPNPNVYHGGQHYGNIVVYLRLKGIVPPSSEPAPQQQQTQPKTETKLPQFDNEQYQFGLLTQGSKWTAENTPEIQKIQEGHMANIAKMAQMGKLFAAGPILDNGDLRGIFIFRAASVDEAKALASEDPAIKAERLKLEILPWFGSKGIGVKAMEEHNKDPKLGWTMKKYHLALLKRGPQTEQPAAEAQKIQLDHLWHIRRMMDEGKMLAAGPFTNNGDLRGIFVLNTESADEAKAWAEADPAVKAGRMTVELHPWLVAKEVWP